MPDGTTTARDTTAEQPQSSQPGVARSLSGASPKQGAQDGPARQSSKRTVGREVDESRVDEITGRARNAIAKIRGKDGVITQEDLDALREYKRMVDAGKAEDIKFRGWHRGGWGNIGIDGWVDKAEGRFNSEENQEALRMAQGSELQQEQLKFAQDERLARREAREAIRAQRQQLLDERENMQATRQLLREGLDRGSAQQFSAAAGQRRGGLLAQREAMRNVALLSASETGRSVIFEQQRRTQIDAQLANINATEFGSSGQLAAQVGMSEREMALKWEQFQEAKKNKPGLTWEEFLLGAAGVAVDLYTAGAFSGGNNAAEKGAKEVVGG